MIIRRAGQKDLKEIVGLALGLHEQHSLYNKYYSLKKNPEPLIKQYYSKLINSSDHYFIVTEENETIIGYAYASIGRRAPYYKEEQFGSLEEIYIREEYRNKGLGKKMINKILSWFKKKGLSYSELEVDTNNKSAIDFWKKEKYTLFINKMLKKID